MSSSMLYGNDDIVEASITKSRPGQKVGLGLVEGEGRCNCSGKKIYVAEVGGLFKKYDLKVGDEVLDVNGFKVTNREKFPNGLKDVKRFLRGEWSVRVRVGRNNSSSSSSRSSHTAATETSDGFSWEEDEEQRRQQEQPENDDSGQQRHDRKELSVATKKENQPLGSPAAAAAPPANNKTKRRGRRRAKKESLGALIRDVRSSTPSARRRCKRRDDRDGNEAESTHGRNGTDKTQSNKTGDMKSTREAGPVRDRCIGGKNETKEAIAKANSSGYRRAADNDKDEQELEVVENQNPNEKKIWGVTCSGSGVTLEMNDGNRVLVNPNELMAFFSEENGKFLAKSTRDVAKNSRAPDAAKSSRASDEAKNSRASDAAKSTKALDASSARRPQLQRSQRERWTDISKSSGDEETEEDTPNHPSPTLQHLRNLVKHKNTSSDQEEKNTKNAPAVSDRNNLVEKTKSIENLLKRNESIRKSLASIILDQDQSSMKSYMAAATNGSSLRLRDLLGDRLKKTDPKKWEESSMVSSTLACMTNLIDPGDVMKIRNLAARPKLNGATVEIVDRAAGENRWNARILQRKHPIVAKDRNKTISVAAENLKHFL